MVGRSLTVKRCHFKDVTVEVFRRKISSAGHKFHIDESGILKSDFARHSVDINVMVTQADIPVESNFSGVGIDVLVFNIVITADTDIAIVERAEDLTIAAGKVSVGVPDIALCDQREIEVCLICGNCFVKDEIVTVGNLQFEAACDGNGFQIADKHVTVSCNQIEVAVRTVVNFCSKRIFNGAVSSHYKSIGR